MVIHMPGDQINGFCLRNGGKRSIADRAAGQRGWRMTCGKRVEDLPELRIRMVAGDEQVAFSERPGSKAGVPRQNGPVLFPGKAYEIVVGTGRVVQDVEAQQPEAFCEFSQHGVGNEFHAYVSPPRRRRGTENKGPREGEK